MPPMKFSNVFCAASATAMPPTPSPASTAITLTPKLWSTARPAKVAMRIFTDFRSTGSRGSRVVWPRRRAWDRTIASPDSTTRRIIQASATISRICSRTSSRRLTVTENCKSRRDRARKSTRISSCTGLATNVLSTDAQLALPSPQQPEPQGRGQLPEGVAQADEEHEGQPLPELGIEKLRLEEHARQRLSEPPIPVARVQVWNRGHARGRELPDEDAVRRGTRWSRMWTGIPGVSMRPTCSISGGRPSSRCPAGLSLMLSTSIGSCWSRTIFR